LRIFAHSSNCLCATSNRLSFTIPFTSVYDLHAFYPNIADANPPQPLSNTTSYHGDILPFFVKLKDQYINILKIDATQMEMEIVVLRLGHRPERDKRITTHIGLVARALGAKCMLLASDDTRIEKSIKGVTRRWGGDFFVRTNVKWDEEIKEWKKVGGKVCHLTMYGVNILDVIDEVREEAKKKKSRTMVIVGAEKVPYEVFETVDWNIAVGNQPHSEVAALALFLDYLQGGEELKKKFKNAEMEIVPKRKGKEIKKGEKKV
jgi:tRNA (cytidine56-2'-O)-methyltransferase